MEQEQEAQPAEVNPLEEKSKEFYNQLFSKDQPEVKLSRRKQKRLEKLQTDLDLGRLEGDEKAKAEADIQWLKGLQEQKAKDQETRRAQEAEQTNDDKPRAKDGKTFNHQLEKLQNKNEQAKLERQQQREEYQRKVNKKLKERTRKARLLTKKTKKGQPVMKNLLGNLMSKIGNQE